ncbi:oxygen-dependent protoporphyrinogen oxidase [Arachnomyces sp. PD_36]|nr:oxygen-dependent protoporphyrinogen oxidase [Arachnomyces sp. PD_36]
MYLQCRLPAHSRELKEVVGRSSLSYLAVRRQQHPSLPQRRLYSKTKRKTLPVKNPVPALSRNGEYSVAVIGGGITGLSAAYKLSRDHKAKVTLYESSSRLGGWMQQTERKEIDGGDVLFEYGPRTMRVNLTLGYSTLHLLLDLGLKDQLLFPGQKSPAARKRYIYNQDRLLQLPTMPEPGANPLVWMFTTLTEIMATPILRDFAWQLALDCLGRKGQGRELGRDETVASFFSRKLSPSAADNLVSAFTHGVYAGDIDKLSVKSVFYSLWLWDQLYPSIFKLPRMMLKKGRGMLPSENNSVFWHESRDKLRQKGAGQTPVPRVREIYDMTKGTNIMTLKGGMAQLVDRLEDVLQGAENVEVKTNARIEKLSGPSNKQMKVELADGSSQTYDYVISTTSPRQLAKQIQGPPGDSTAGSTAVTRLLTSEGTDYAITVMVVNLYYENPNLLPVRGFGYLIPRSVPLAQNPERALGVIFGSDVGIGQDTAQGTKLTVMLGGHWWDGWQESDYPDEQKAIEMARNLLKRHLNISETPTVTGTRLQRDAIPQPTVGHHDRMAQLDQALIRGYGDRLKVGGAWYTGVGINDCVRAGTLMGLRLINQKNDSSPATGLGSFSLKDGVAWDGESMVFQKLSGRPIPKYYADLDADERRITGDAPTQPSSDKKEK